MSSRPPATGATVEIAHEAIAHHWPRLRGWLALEEAARFANPVPAAPFGVNGRVFGIGDRIRRVHRPRRGRPAHKRRAENRGSGTPGSGKDGAAGLQQPDALGSVEVAHEALIRHWPRLRGWLDEDRSSLLLREAVSEAAQAWEQSGQDESYLAHRGRRLDEAEALAHHPRFALNAQERAYLDAALALRQREEQEREAQRQRELAAQRERAELAEAAQREAEQRVAEQAVAAKRLQRRLLLAVGLGGLAILAAIFAFVNFQKAGVQQAVAVSAASTAVAERVRADEQAAIARIQALTAQARVQHDLGKDELGALLAREAFRLSQGNGGALRDQVDGALRAALGVPYYSQLLDAHAAPVTAVAFGAEAYALATGSSDGTVRLWDLRDPATAPTTLRGAGSPVLSVAFSRDGQWIVSGASDGSMRLWRPSQPADDPFILTTHELALANAPELDGLSQIAVTAADHGVSAVAFSPDRQTLAAGSRTGTVGLWHMSDLRAPPVALPGQEGPVTSISFRADGAILAAGSEDGAIRLWNLDDPSAAPTILAGQDSAVSSVAFSPQGSTLAAGGRDGVVRVWDSSNPTAAPSALAAPAESAPQIVMGETLVSSVAYSPDGQRLAAGSNDATVWLWELRDPSAAPTVLRGPERPVAERLTTDAPAVAFSSDGRTLAAGNRDGTVRLWSLHNPVAPRVLDGHEGNVYGVAFSPNRPLLASGGMDGLVRLWRPFDADPSASPFFQDSREHGAPTVAFSPDGMTLAAGRFDGTVHLWTLGDPSGHPTGAPRILTRSDGVRALAFSPDGQFLAAGGMDGAIVVWSLAAPDPASTFVTLTGHGDGSGYDNRVTSLAFSPDGETLASSGWDGSVRVWEMGDSPKERAVLLDRRDDLDSLGVTTARITAVAISPDGRLLAAGGWDGLVRLWNTHDVSAAPTIWRGHEGPILSLAFSPDGRTLAFGSSDGVVRLRDLQNEVVAQVTLAADGGPARSIAYSPDGRTLAVGSEDANIRLWIADTESLSDLVCLNVRRNLSQDEWGQYVGPDVPYQRTCSNLPPGAGAPPDPAFEAATPQPSGPS